MTATPTPSPGASGAGEVPLPEPVTWDGRRGLAGADAFMPDQLRAYGDARAAHATREARAEERARVVAWLRTMGQARIGEQYNDRMNACGRTYLAAAHVIEGGGHE